MKLFIYLFYLYLTVFTVYYLVLAIAGSKNVKKNRDTFGKRYNNLCVVVYSHNNQKTIENLVKQLKNQVYPKNNYTIQVVLDNCSDQSEILFQGDLDVNVMNIKNVDTIGRDQAFSIILEKYSQIRDLDAYVFLDARYFVNTDFLDKVNDSLQKNDVVTGATTLICNDELSFMDNIKYSYNQYKNNFISRSRELLGLSNLINSEVVAIKKSVLDEMGSIKVKDENEELQFTLDLSKQGVKCAFSSDAKIYIDVEKYVMRTPRLSKRLNLFFNNVLKFKLDNKLYSEMIASLIYPNCLTLFIGYYLVFHYAYNVNCLLNPYVVGGGIAVLIMSFCASLINARIHSKEHLYLFCYPVYSLFKIVYNFPLIRWVRNRIFNEGIATRVDKMTANVYVSDGMRYYPCKLEIIAEAGMSRVVFINKKKKYKTKNHLRVIDAINEIVQKLESFGYMLRICQCCKYYSTNVDGSVNQVKGFCKYQFPNRTPGDILPTVLWRSCEAFDKVNVVNLMDAISAKKQDENNK